MVKIWFDAWAKLLASQMKGYNFRGAHPEIFILNKGKLPKDVSVGVKDFLNSIGDIQYISIRPGEEANYIVFLTETLDKFEETYLVD